MLIEWLVCLSVFMFHYISTANQPIVTKHSHSKVLDYSSDKFDDQEIVHETRSLAKKSANHYIAVNTKDKADM